MSSVATIPDSVTKPTSDALIGDVLAYGLAAACGQTLSHLALARDPQLPETWEQLVARYSAGSGIVAATLTVYALRHPYATARDSAVLHWGVLLGCGLAVGALHLADYLHARELAREMDTAYAREDAGHVARTKTRPPFPLSLYRGA